MHNLEKRLSSFSVSELLHFEHSIHWYLPFVVTYCPLVAVRMYVLVCSDSRLTNQVEIFPNLLDQ